MSVGRLGDSKPQLPCQRYTLLHKTASRVIMLACIVCFLANTGRHARTAWPRCSPVGGRCRTCTMCRRAKCHHRAHRSQHSRRDHGTASLHGTQRHARKRREKIIASTRGARRVGRSTQGTTSQSVGSTTTQRTKARRLTRRHQSNKGKDKKHHLAWRWVSD